MMKNIGIIVPVLLAFLLNVEALDFSRCDAFNSGPNFSPTASRQCQAEVCGYEEDPTACFSFEMANYGPVAYKTGIALLVLMVLLVLGTLLLIIVVIIEKVNDNTVYIDNFYNFQCVGIYTKINEKKA